MKQNQNQNPEHKPTNVVDNETIFSIKLMELETGLPALLEDTMKPETYKRFVKHMNKNGKK